MEQIYIFYRLTHENWWMRTRCPLDQRWSLHAAVCPVKRRHKSPCCSDFIEPFGINCWADRIQTTLLEKLGFAVGRATFPSSNEAKKSLTIPVAQRSKAWVCGRLLAEIVGSNPAGAWKSVSFECCVFSGSGFCVWLIIRPEESYQVWCVWVWSWILDNEEALAHWGCCAVVKKFITMFKRGSHSYRKSNTSDSQYPTLFLLDQF